MLLNSKAKNLLSTWKLGSIKKSDCWFCACIVTFIRGFYQVIMHLNPKSNCFSSFALSLVDKVTNET